MRPKSCSLLPLVLIGKTLHLGTKEAGKYMVALNPGSDSQEEGIMDEEVGR